MFGCCCPSHMVLHAAAHLFHDGEIAGAIRDLVDLDSLLRYFGDDPKFWGDLMGGASTLGLTRPAYYALRYAENSRHANPFRGGGPRSALEPIIDRAFPYGRARRANAAGACLPRLGWIGLCVVRPVALVANASAVAGASPAAKGDPITVTATLRCGRYNTEREGGHVQSRRSSDCCRCLPHLQSLAAGQQGRTINPEAIEFDAKPLNQSPLTQYRVEFLRQVLNTRAERPVRLDRRRSSDVPRRRHVARGSDYGVDRRSRRAICRGASGDWWQW